MRETKENPGRKLLSRDVVLVMTAGFCYMACSMIGISLTAGFAAELGASPSATGAIAASMSFISLFCRPFAGILSDKFSKRAVAWGSSSLLLAANIGCCFAKTPLFLTICRTVNGVGFSVISVCIATWMTMMIPISRMGAGMGLYGIVNALAIAVGPALGIRLQAAVGYQWTFIASLTLNVCAFVTVLLVKNGGRPARKTVAAEQSLRHRLSLRNLVEPRAIPLAAVFMMFAIPYFANQSFLVDYISTRHLRISSDLFFVFYAAALLVLRLTLRDLFDSKGFRFWLVVCSFAMLASLAFLTFMTNDWYLLGAGIAMAASYGLMSSVTQAQAVVIAGREHSGLANGTYYMGIDLGMALGPVLAGVLYGHLPIAWFYPPVHAGTAGVLADLPVLPPSHPSVAQVTDRHRSR